MLAELDQFKKIQLPVVTVEGDPILKTVGDPLRIVLGEEIITARTTIYGKDLDKPHEDFHVVNPTQKIGDYNTDYLAIQISENVKPIEGYIEGEHTVIVVEAIDREYREIGKVVFRLKEDKIKRVDIFSVKEGHTGITEVPKYDENPHLVYSDSDDPLNDEKELNRVQTIIDSSQEAVVYYLNLVSEHIE